MAKLKKLLTIGLISVAALIFSSCENEDTALIAHIKTLNKEAWVAFEEKNYNKAAKLSGEAIDLINDNRGAEDMHPKIAEAVSALSIQATSIRNNALRERAYQTDINHTS